MLNKFREKYVYIYAICIALLFKASQKLSTYPEKLLEKTSLYPIDSSAKFFFSMVITDLIVVIVMLLVLWATNHLYLLKKKGTGFFKGLSIGAYQIVFSSLIMAFMILASIKEGLKLNSAFNIVIFILCMSLVGISEELCCRALIAESLLEHCGASKKALWKAAIISGVVFGLLHLFNMKSQNPISTIAQAIMASATGIMYAAIYFRSGNIWALAFLHALNDIAAASAFGLFSGMDLMSAFQAKTDGGVFQILILAIPEIIVATYLLRDKKLEDIKEVWPEIENK